MKLTDYENEVEMYMAYTEGTNATAIYPGVNSEIGWIYPVLGFAGESGEIYEKYVNGDVTGNFGKEIGDACYYVARLSLELPFDTREFWQDVVDTMVADESHQYPPLMHTMIGQVLSVAELLKKWWRDDNEEKLAVIRAKLIMYFIGLVRLAKLHEFEIVDVLQENHDKLADRKERGVIQGDGDTR